MASEQLTHEEMFANARRIGVAQNPDTKETYVMWLLHGMTPCIENESTGAIWSLHWFQMVDMAKAEFSKSRIILDNPPAVQ